MVGRGESNTRRNLLKSQNYRSRRQDYTNIGTNTRKTNPRACDVRQATLVLRHDV